MLVTSAGRRTSVSRFNGTDWDSHPLTFLTGANFVSSLRETADGTVWISGLNRLYVHTGGKWVMHDTRDLDLPGNSLRMHISSDGALWLIGFEQYAARIAMSLSECVALDNVTWQCTDSLGSEWYIESAAEQIVCRRDDGTVVYGADRQFIAHPKAILPTPGGVVAIGRNNSSAALSIFDGTKWTMHRFPQVAADFSSTGVHISHDGTIWVAAAGERVRGQVGGVIAGNGDVWHHYKPPDAPVFANSIAEGTNGELFFAGGDIVTRFDGDSWSEVRDELFENNRCPSVDISPDGTIWVASATRGVLMGKDGQWQSLATDHGLQSTDINSVVAVNNSDVWVSTSRGVFRFDGAGFHRLDLPISLGRRSLHRDLTGRIRIDGCHCLYPSAKPPRTRIEEDAVSFAHNGRSVLPLRAVDAWNWTPDAKLSYSIQIDDEPWTPFEEQRLLVLEDLPPGDHTVRVRARDQDFNMSTAEHTVSVSVVPPFWQSTLFIGLCSAAAAIVIGQAFRLMHRGRELRRSHQSLEIAQSRLEGQFAEKSEQFRAVCDCSPVGIFVADQSAQVIYSNRKMQDILGESDESALLGGGWARVLDPEERTQVIQGLRNAAAQEKGFESSGRFVRSDGTHVWFEMMAECIQHNGEMRGFVCAVEDVTDRRTAETDLRSSNAKLTETLEQLQHAQELAIRSERLGALGQMAAGVAHDINNALSPLLTYAELLSGEIAENKGAERLTELIRL